jgi:transketolase
MVYELAKKDKRVVFVGSDLGMGTLKPFKDEMPDRFFMEGVSEAHLVSMSAGLAMEGKIPYLNTIATFITRRCFEQNVLDLCLQNTKVRLIGNGGGLVYAPLGPTHLAIEDIAIFRAIPRMTIIAVADAEEMKRMMPETLDYPRPIYIRLAKGGDPVVTRSAPFIIGKAYAMRQGNDVAIITTGVALQVALEAADELAIGGIKAAVVHAPTVKPLDSEAILDAISDVRAVVTVEEHSIIGGLGSAVAELMCEAGTGEKKKFRRIGIPDVFPDQYGSQDSLMERYGITSEKVAQVITELL